MNKGKIIVISIGTVVLALSTMTYSVFFGVPGGESRAEKTMEAYVEKKYDMKVTAKKTFFNVKNGGYGSEFKIDGNPKETFEVEQFKSGEVLDYYPESVWVREAEQDIYPALQKSFPSLTVEDKSVNPVYGMGSDLGIKKDIPSYKDVDTGVDVGIQFKEVWTEENEKILLQESLDFVKTLQNKGVKNLGIRLYLKEKDEDVKGDQSFSIALEGKEMETIQSIDDLKKHIEIF